jgi:hypothetical protein
MECLPQVENLPLGCIVCKDRENSFYVLAPSRFAFHTLDSSLIRLVLGVNTLERVKTSIWRLYEVL